MIKFALLGAGRIGKMHANNIVLNSQSDLEVVYDVNNSAAREVSNMHNCKIAHSAEEAITNKIGSKARSLFVNSGSSANLLALSSLCQKNMLEELKMDYIQPGDEIITAAAGFPTTINPIFQKNLLNP